MEATCWRRGACLSTCPPRWFWCRLQPQNRGGTFFLEAGGHTFLSLPNPPSQKNNKTFCWVYHSPADSAGGRKCLRSSRLCQDQFDFKTTEVIFEKKKEGGDVKAKWGQIQNENTFQSYLYFLKYFLKSKNFGKRGMFWKSGHFADWTSVWKVEAEWVSVDVTVRVVVVRSIRDWYRIWRHYVDIVCVPQYAQLCQKCMKLI